MMELRRLQQTWPQDLAVREEFGRGLVNTLNDAKSEDDLQRLARAWGVTWRPAQCGAYIDHTSLVVVVGPDGRERLRYGFSQLGDPAAVARDISHILHEK